MFSYVSYNDIVTTNETIAVKVGNGYVVPEIVVDLIRGQVFKNKGQTYPFVLYIYPYRTSNNQLYPIGIIAYEKIAFSNYLQLGLGIPISLAGNDTAKLFANFKLEYTGYNGYVKRQGVYDPSVRVYKFTPFAIYRIEAMENGTWTKVYDSINGGGLEVKSGNTTLPLTGEQKLKLYISAFGRDVKNGTLIFEAYNGTKLVDRQVLVEGLNIDHLNETPPVEVTVNIPQADKYRFVLLQEGPVGGVTNGPVYVNGKIANPSMPLKPGESGKIELTEAFEKGYTNVKFTLRGVVYYYVTPNGNDIYKPEFYLEPHMDIIGYIPVAELDKVQRGDNVISGQASVPKDFFDSYVQKLKKEYGNKVVIVSKRLEPIFLAQKEYMLWEGH